VIRPRRPGMPCGSGTVRSMRVATVAECFLPTVTGVVAPGPAGRPVDRLTVERTIPATTSAA
jgi:hypothetical protein